MAEYISSFVSGFAPVIGEVMARSLPGARILRVYDGLVHYAYGGSEQNINRLAFFNNTYLVYRAFQGNALSFDKMVSQAFVPAEKGNKPGTFRVRFSKEGRFVKVSGPTAAAAERAISAKTRMRVDRVNPQHEYWFIIRSEGAGFFAKLLRKRKTTEKALHKGELRPEFALLLCAFAKMRRGETVCDPFAGYGAIPLQAAQSRGIEKLYISDCDRGLVDRLSGMDAWKRCPCKVSIRCEDALQLPSIRDHELSLILTDPPWGYYEDIPDIAEFYRAMLRSFKRVLKRDGRAVVLSARKDELAAAIKEEKGTIAERLDTLVNGKKAGIYMIRFPQ